MPNTSSKTTVPSVYITRIRVKNYRSLACVDLPLQPGKNILVGDNETGKSTLLEAVNLALKCQLNRRPLSYELHPLLFNQAVICEYLDAIRDEKKPQPPSVLIELYLKGDDSLADFSGTNNSLQENVPGIKLEICLDPDCASEYAEYIKTPESLKTIPIDLYKVMWRDFSDHAMNAFRMPLKSVLVDPSTISNTHGANKFVLETIRDYLSKTERASLSLSYRKLHDVFVDDAQVKAINKKLGEEQKSISDKLLSV
jgi:energy-coupling factor transporter ATP-binding protein EcfA2